MPRRKRPVEPLECDPVTLAELEDVAHEILNASMPEKQRRENRNPTEDERHQKFKLERPR